MSQIQNFEQHSRYLIEPDLPIQGRLQMVMEVRDSLEITHTGEYLNFLKCYFRAFSAILYQITKPQFVDNPEHKLRNIVVEILNHLPHSEVLRPFVQELLKLYSRLVQTNIPQLLPLMVTAISVPGPEKAPPHLKSHFIELKGAQVKSFSDYIKQHEESICKSVVNLLVTCSDSVSIRKELLVALKHVLGTDFKRGFFPLIDTLLEDRVLVGTGRACFETLRPLAYSLLAEIVYHVRVELSLSQILLILF